MTIVKSTGQDFEKIPAGNAQAICIGEFDLGIQRVFNKKDQKEKLTPQVRIVWELAEMNKQGERFIISKTYTKSLHENANLRKDLVSWRGKDFSEQELEGFELSNIVGKNCLLNIVHSEDGKYANVLGVSSLPKGMDPIIQSRQIPEKMMDKIKEKQKQSINLDDGLPSEIPDDGDVVPF